MWPGPSSRLAARPPALWASSIPASSSPALWASSIPASSSPALWASSIPASSSPALWALQQLQGRCGCSSSSRAAVGAVVAPGPLWALQQRPQLDPRGLRRPQRPRRSGRPVGKLGLDFPGKPETPSAPAAIRAGVGACAGAGAGGSTAPGPRPALRVPARPPGPRPALRVPARPPGPRRRGGGG